MTPQRPEGRKGRKRGKAFGVSEAEVLDYFERKTREKQEDEDPWGLRDIPLDDWEDRFRHD